MEREIDLKEISDGRFYDLNDMVKAGCDDCRGLLRLLPGGWENPSFWTRWISSG